MTQLEHLRLQLSKFICSLEFLQILILVIVITMIISSIFKQEANNYPYE